MVQRVHAKWSGLSAGSLMAGEFDDGSVAAARKRGQADEDGAGVSRGPESRGELSRGLDMPHLRAEQRPETLIIMRVDRGEIAGEEACHGRCGRVARRGRRNRHGGVADRRAGRRRWPCGGAARSSRVIRGAAGTAKRAAGSCGTVAGRGCHPAAARAQFDGERGCPGSEDQDDQHREHDGPGPAAGRARRLGLLP